MKDMQIGSYRVWLRIETICSQGRTKQLWKSNQNKFGVDLVTTWKEKPFLVLSKMGHYTKEVTNCLVCCGSWFQQVLTTTACCPMDGVTHALVTIFLKAIILFPCNFLFQLVDLHGDVSDKLYGKINMLCVVTHESSMVLMAYINNFSSYSAYYPKRLMNIVGEWLKTHQHSWRMAFGSNFCYWARRHIFSSVWEYPCFKYVQLCLVRSAILWKGSHIKKC